MNQPLLDDFQSLQDQFIPPPDKTLLLWCTIGVALHTWVSHFPARWLNYSADEVFLIVLFLSLFAAVPSFIWSAVRAFRYRQWRSIGYTILWVLVFGLTFSSQASIGPDPYIVYGAQLEVPTALFLLLLIELQPKNAIRRPLWVGLSYLAQAYVLQWLLIELSSLFDVYELRAFDVARFVVTVPLTLALLVALWQMIKTARLLRLWERLAWLALLLGCYSLWIGTGCYWMGDQLLELAQMAGTLESYEQFKNNNAWELRGDYAHGIGLVLTALALYTGMAWALTQHPKTTSARE